MRLATAGQAWHHGVRHRIIAWPGTPHGRHGRKGHIRPRHRLRADYLQMYRLTCMHLYTYLELPEPVEFLPFLWKEPLGSERLKSFREAETIHQEIPTIQAPNVPRFYCKYYVGTYKSIASLGWTYSLCDPSTHELIVQTFTPKIRSLDYINKPLLQARSQCSHGSPGFFPPFHFIGAWHYAGGPALFAAALT